VLSNHHPHASYSLHTISSSELDISPSNYFQAFWVLELDKLYVLTSYHGDFRLACHPVGPVYYIACACPTAVFFLNPILASTPMGIAVESTEWHSSWARIKFYLMTLLHRKPFFPRRYGRLQTARADEAYITAFMVSIGSSHMVCLTFVQTSSSYHRS
jgi:hypothetical protein